VARPDWSEGDTYAALKPGAYHVEVLTAEERTSKNGDAMFNIKLIAVDWNGAHICFDNIMLAGKGRSMGQAKLVALGIPRGQAEVRPDELVGARAFAFIGEGEWQGKKRLEVDISEGSHCGYWLESERDDVGELNLPDPDQADGPVDNPFDDLAADDTPF